MAIRLRCPACASIFAAPAGGQPVCPSCHYGAAAPSGPSFSPGGPSFPSVPGTAAAPTAATGHARTHWAAVAALVAGIGSFLAGFVGLPMVAMVGPFGFLLGFAAAVLAIILGGVGVGAINKAPHTYSGKGMAVTGLVLGIVNLALTILMFVMAMFVFWAIWSAFWA